MIYIWLKDDGIFTQVDYNSREEFFELGKLPLTNHEYMQFTMKCYVVEKYRYVLGEDGIIREERSFQRGTVPDIHGEQLVPG